MIWEIILRDFFGVSNLTPVSRETSCGISHPENAALPPRITADAATVNWPTANAIW
jgi:hypothetical protein